MEIMHSIDWYLLKTNKSIDAINQLRTPADLNKIRYEYGVLIESMFSLVDYTEDKRKHFNNNKLDMENNIIKEIEINGGVIVKYLREVRNAVIHRGFDVATSGLFYGDRISILAPDVTDRNGKLIEKPNENNLDKLLAIFESALKKTVESELVKLDLLNKSNYEEINKLASNLKEIKIPEHAPEVIKGMMSQYVIDEKQAIEMATGIYFTTIDNLNDKLLKRMDVTYLP